MGINTKIEWCDHTWNPWRGCSKVSAGCQNCYAERQAKRRPDILGEWGPDARRVVASESYWRQPLVWNRAAEKAGERRRVFCGSMMDVFEDRPDLDTPRARLFRTIAATPHLDWLLLTKRPQSIERCLSRLFTSDFNGKLYVGPGLRLLSNIWLGVSCENQETADARIPHLLQIPAAVRFLSLEPLLGPIDLQLDGIHWVIVGGESGPNARKCKPDWIRYIRNQCWEAGVPLFIKQMGDYWAQLLHGVHRSPKGSNMSEWPEDLRIREFPS